MKLCIPVPICRLLYSVIISCSLFSADVAAIGLSLPKVYPDGKIGVIGDSIAAGTHSSQILGETHYLFM